MQVAGAGEDAGEVLGEAELLIGLAVLFQEDGGFELAAARVVVDQADIEVAGELASAGVAGDHAGVRGGGDRDVGRGDRVGDGGRVQGGEAEIGDDTGGGSGVVLDRERAGPFGPDAVEIGIVRVGETIREGQGGGLRRNRSGAEVVMAGIDAANAGQARRGDGRIVGDELQDIIDKEFHLIADHFERKVPVPLKPVRLVTASSR